MDLLQASEEVGALEYNPSRWAPPPSSTQERGPGRPRAGPRQRWWEPVS